MTFAPWTPASGNYSNTYGYQLELLFSTVALSILSWDYRLVFGILTSTYTDILVANPRQRLAIKDQFKTPTPPCLLIILLEIATV
jgi:hypothetical protein